MVIIIQDYGKIIKLINLGFINGQIHNDIKDNGIKELSMESEEIAILIKIAI